MQVTVNFGRENQENLVDLVAEAITSSRPPLSQRSILQINLITETRLATLEGSDKFLAHQLFSNLDELPPLIGFEFSLILSPIIESDFLTTMPESDFTGSNILARVTAARQAVLKDTQPQDIVDDWGYASVSGTFEGESSACNFNLDMLKARREGSSKIDNIFTLLSHIKNSEERKALVSDCLSIMKLRRDFDFRERPEDS